MATVRKGSGTTGRRRTKSTATETTIAKHEKNGGTRHNGAADAGSHIDFIRVRAYELFLARGATHGDDLADWFTAERELRGARNL